MYDIIEAHLDEINKHLETMRKDCESNFDDFRDIDEEEKEKYISEKLSKHPIHLLIKPINLDELLWDIDALGLYPSAIWEKKSIYPRI